MFALWIMIVLLCLLVATGSALLALRFQYHLLDKTTQEREAWQQAQESRQRTWEVRQGKHILDIEKKLADQLKEARREWRAWSIEVEQKQQDWQDRAEVEPELARLPHVEQLELPLHPGDQRQRPKNWRPPRLYRAELNGRDLSYRYMERADLREALLAEANFHMADLAGASLTGADLEHANLTGANLSGVDLRGANLTGANFLVADLHQAILHGANLAGARNLSQQQLQTAIYDGSTILNSTASHVSESQTVSSALPLRQESTGSASSVLSDASQSAADTLFDTSMSTAHVSDVAPGEELPALPVAQESLAAQQETDTPGEPGSSAHLPETPTTSVSSSETSPRKRLGVSERKKAKNSEKRKTSVEKSVDDTRKIIQLPTRTGQTIPLSMLVSPKRGQRTSGALSLNLEMPEELEKAENQQGSRLKPSTEGQNAG